MSHTGLTLTACIQPSKLPTPLRSLDDLTDLTLDESTSVLIFSRNAWINHRMEELVQLERLQLLPTAHTPVTVASGPELEQHIAGMRTFLARLEHDPRHLPAAALELADEGELERITGLAPPNLDSAHAALKTARARDEEGESVETLLCLLWCQLRLAEFASANALCFLCLRDP